MKDTEVQSPQRNRFRLWMLLCFFIPLFMGIISATYGYEGKCGGWMDSTPQNCSFVQYAHREASFAYMLFFIPLSICCALWLGTAVRLLLKRKNKSDKVVIIGGVFGAVIGLLFAVLYLNLFTSL